MINVSERHYNKIIDNIPGGSLLLSADLVPVKGFIPGRGKPKDKLVFSYEHRGSVFKSSLGVNWGTLGDEITMGQKIKSRANIEKIKSQNCVVDFLCTDVVDADHVKTRGAGGSDEISNLLPTCRKHHVMRHQKGILWMCETYPNYRRALVEKGHGGLIQDLLYKRSHNGGPVEGDK